MSKICILGDIHAGHCRAITPSKWWSEKTSDEVKRLYKWYLRTLRKIGPVDSCIVNGDCIDGSAKKNSGIELITNNLTEQCSMAETIIKKVQTNKYYFTYGTPYHANTIGAQMETNIARNLNGKIGNQLNLEVGRYKINARHHVGNSSVAHGVATPIMKEAYYLNHKNTIDVVIRSHVHRYCLIQTSEYIAFSTPALQLNSNYGEQRCIGQTDIGIVVVTLTKKGPIVTPYLFKGIK